MPKGHKLTTKQYISNAKEKWGDKFNYSKTVYKNAITKIIIICAMGHKFLVLPHSHLSKNKANKGSCAECARIKISEKACEKFLKKAIEKRGKTIDYSTFVWLGVRKKTAFVCKTHGVFLQRPGDHLISQNPCPDCKEEDRIKKLTEKYKKLTPEYIEKFKKIHNNFYSYSKYEFRGAQHVSTIICPIHGDFEQCTHNHETGSGCHKCTRIIISQKQTKSQDKFIKEVTIVHPNLVFTDFKYTGKAIKSTVYCPKHNHTWSANPNNLLNGAGCYHCGIERNIQNSMTSPEEFINRCEIKHNFFYDYSSTNYRGTQHNIDVKCPHHGLFSPLASNHLHNGTGCPSCVNQTEGKLYNWFNIYFPNLASQQFAPRWCMGNKGRPRKYDLVIEDIKLIIELDGRQHFEYVGRFHQNDTEGFKKQQDIDIYKMTKANENGYSVIRLLTKDVRGDKNNWENKLLECIKQYDTPTNIFICSNDEYNEHKILLEEDKIKIETLSVM